MRNGHYELCSKKMDIYGISAENLLVVKKD